MMECKKAIQADGVDGDYDKAADWLRKNSSVKTASKLAGRDAVEGLVGLHIVQSCGSGGNERGSLVKIASETDFASRSPDFVALVDTVAAAVTEDASVSQTVDVDTFISENAAVKQAMEDAVLSIRENLQIASATTMVAMPDSQLVGYVHGKVDTTKMAGTAAALVQLEVVQVPSKPTKEIEEIGKKLAMHIVAAKPTYLSPDDVPEDVLSKEREILLDQMQDSGKPPEILAKIIDGRLRKFYEGVCLTEQGHLLEEGTPKVSKCLSQLGLKVSAFQSVFVQQ